MHSKPNPCSCYGTKKQWMFFSKSAKLNCFVNFWKQWCKTGSYLGSMFWKVPYHLFLHFWKCFFFGSPSWFILPDKSATTTYKITLPKVERKMVRNFSKHTNHPMPEKSQKIDFYINKNNCQNIWITIWRGSRTKYQNKHTCFWVRRIAFWQLHYLSIGLKKVETRFSFTLKIFLLLKKTQLEESH